MHGGHNGNEVASLVSERIQAENADLLEKCFSNS